MPCSLGCADSSLRQTARAATGCNDTEAMARLSYRVEIRLTDVILSTGAQAQFFGDVLISFPWCLAKKSEVL
jgi:hypothetical protein